MPHKRLLIIAGLLLTSTSAHAIPPPDVFMSLWQSILQMFGMLSAERAESIISALRRFTQ